MAVSRGAPFGFSQVVFLSHVLTSDTPVFPGDPPVEIGVAATMERDGYFLHRVAFGEQAGTHWAAPAHFSPGEAAADQLDPAGFFFPAAVVDIRHQAAADHAYAATVADLTAWEAAHGQVPSGAAVLLRTGWDERWPDPARYAERYPGFSAQAADWLVTERGVAALGTDTMGIDPSSDLACAANRALLHGHRIHLENLCGLDALPQAGAWIVVGGIRVAGGSGSPATVFGLVP